jgi:uncharacterized protein
MIGARPLIPLLVGVLGIVLGAPSARAQTTYPPRLPDDAFIFEEAGMIRPDDMVAISEVCATLLAEKRIPIKVVTITSMDDHGAGGWTIERYAHNLFDEWGIGSEDYNYGILLLISEGDRRARIELGADWGREHDEAAQKIMDRMIIPSFKAGAFSAGIVSGVDGLDKMARGEDIPGSPMGDAARAAGNGIRRALIWARNNLFYALFLPVFIILILLRGVRGGWYRGGYYGGGYHGGGFGGGGFGGGGGGGFSGGGGASGGW